MISSPFQGSSRAPRIQIVLGLTWFTFSEEEGFHSTHESAIMHCRVEATPLRPLGGKAYRGITDSAWKRLRNQPTATGTATRAGALCNLPFPSPATRAYSSSTCTYIRHVEVHFSRSPPAPKRHPASQIHPAVAESSPRAPARQLYVAFHYLLTLECHVFSSSSALWRSGDGAAGISFFFIWS